MKASEARQILNDKIAQEKDYYDNNTYNYVITKIIDSVSKDKTYIIYEDMRDTPHYNLIQRLEEDGYKIEINKVVDRSDNQLGFKYIIEW